MTTYTISNGQTSSATITGGDTLLVAYGGTSSNSVITNGQEIVSGQSVNDILSGASQSVASRASALGTQLTSGSITVDGGGATFNDVVTAGAVSVAAGASIHNLTLDGGAISLGGTEFGGTISAGDLYVSGPAYRGAGSALGVTLLSGASIDVMQGYVSGTILSGVTLTLNGLTPSLQSEGDATQVMAGGQLVVDKFGNAYGSVIGSGGFESVAVGAFSTGVVISGGTLDLAYGNDAYNIGNPPSTAQVGPIQFGGSGGSVIAHGSKAPGPNGAITGFDATDKIIFPDITADPAAKLTVSGDTVTLTAGGQTYTLDIVGASSIPLTLGIGTNSGSIDIGVACYCAGTAILTGQGDKPVETIAPGDHVITADGRAEPVVWVGRRSYAGRFLRRQPHLLPIRIRAGALGAGLPRRDLLVSPNHALLLDGVLVPAEALVGTPGITVERGCEQVDYHHIELARHDVILAEGAPAETFMDDDSRGIFQASEGMPGKATAFCAPRMADGYELEAIRRRLAA